MAYPFPLTSAEKSSMPYAMTEKHQMVINSQGVSSPGGKLSDGKTLLGKATRLQTQEYLLLLSVTSHGHALL